MKYQKWILLALVLPLSAFAQEQSLEQCLSTIKARAAISLDDSDIETLCKEYSVDVVNCALTQSQGNHFTSSLEQSLKACEREQPIVYINTRHGK